MASTELDTIVFNAIYNAVSTSYESADFSGHYVPQPPSFPHVQVWKESDTVALRDMTLSGTECFSTVIYHVEVFDNEIDGGGMQNVDAICEIINNVMLSLGFRRTYSAPVPNFEDASVYRKVQRYSRKQENTL